MSVNQVNELHSMKPDEINQVRNALRQKNIAFYQRVSTILTSSSVETVKKESQNIQLTSQNKSVLKSIHQEHQGSNTKSARRQFLELRQ